MEDPSIVAHLSVSLQSDWYLIGSLENQCLDVSFSCPDLLLSLWHGRKPKTKIRIPSDTHGPNMRGSVRRTKTLAYEE